MKMMSLRRTWICFLALSILPLDIAIALQAKAQDYPNQTVKILSLIHISEPTRPY